MIILINLDPVKYKFFVPFNGNKRPDICISGWTSATPEAVPALWSTGLYDHNLRSCHSESEDKPKSSYSQRMLEAYGTSGL